MLSKRWFWRILKLAAAIAVVGIVVYRTKFNPVTVDVREVQRGTIVADVLGTGTLEARVSATISPKISGRIAKVLVDQGDQVTAGQLLVQLDDEELNQQVAIGEANVDAAAAGIERLKTDKNRAIAVFEQAQRSYDRIATLVQRKAASQDEADKATEGLAVATAGVSRAEAAIAEGQTEVVSAEKTLAYHRARLDDTLIVAPFDGLIIRRNREPGDVVVPGSSIMTLISMDELWISAWVDETEMARLQPDQPARVEFRSEPDRSYPGKVTRLGREADRETREYVVDVQVLQLPVNWAVGQRAEVFIEVAKRDDVLTLPAKMIASDGGEVGVFLNDRGKATWHPIQTGLRSRVDVEVTEGLAQGDLVIAPIDTDVKLKDGKRVTTR